MVRNFVRLAIRRELTEEEVENFFKFVEDVADVEDTSAFDSDGNEVDDVVVTMYEVEGTFMYEVAVAEDVDLQGSREIVRDLMGIMEDDFELDIETI